MMQILEYHDPAGRSPFQSWFDGLDPQAAAKITVALTRLAQGNFSSVKGIGSGVLEFRVDFGPGYRIYFGRDGQEFVILLAAAQNAASSKTSRRRLLDGRTINDARKKRHREMALTKEFKETVKARAARDPAFREALLKEAIEQFLAGELETGKAVLRDYINATVGFAKLARATGTPTKSLMRMLGPSGNPRASNLLTIIAKLQRVTGLHLAVATQR
jgi:putative addiction module killer protein